MDWGHFSHFAGARRSGFGRDDGCDQRLHGPRALPDPGYPVRGLERGRSGSHLQLLGGVFPRWRAAFRVADRPLRPDLRHRLALRRQHRLILLVRSFPELCRAGGGPRFRRLRERRLPPGLGLDNSQHRFQNPAQERPPTRGARHLPERRRGDRTCPGYHIVAIWRRVRAFRGADRDRRGRRDPGAARFRELGNSASGSEPGSSVNHGTPREQPAGRRFRVRHRADIRCCRSRPSGRAP